MSKTNEEKNGTVKVGGNKSATRLSLTVLLIISAVLTVIAAVSVYLFMSFIGYTKSDREYKTVYIRSGKEFVEQMRARIVGKEYCLLSSIDIDAEEWNDTMSDTVLRGSINGNGNVVSIRGTLEIPIFSRIEKGSAVSGVSFTNVALGGGKSVSKSILAQVNYGTVSNCSVLNATATVGEEQYEALFVAHNFGKIENCVASGKFVAGSNCVAGRTAVGSVAAINYKGAEINGCIVDIEYSDGFKAIENAYFNENEVNDKLGYAVGQNNGAVVGVYCLNAARFGFSSDGKTVNGVRNLKNSELTAQLVSSAGFLTDFWTVGEGQLPTLKVLMGVDA